LIVGEVLYRMKRLTYSFSESEAKGLPRFKTLIDMWALSSLFKAEPKKLFQIFRNKEEPGEMLRFSSLSKDKLPKSLEEKFAEYQKEAAKYIESIIVFYLDGFVESKLKLYSSDDYKGRGSVEQRRRDIGAAFAPILAPMLQESLNEVEARLTGPLTLELSTSKHEYHERVESALKEKEISSNKLAEAMAKIEGLQAKLKKEEEARQETEDRLKHTEVELNSLQNSADCLAQELRNNTRPAATRFNKPTIKLSAELEASIVSLEDRLQSDEISE